MSKNGRVGGGPSLDGAESQNVLSVELNRVRWCQVFGQDYRWPLENSSGCILSQQDAKQTLFHVPHIVHPGLEEFLVQGQE